MNIAIEIQKYEDCYEDGYKHFHHKTIFFGSKKNGSDYEEEGMSILGLWTPAMYEQQWREGLERITKEEYSCLVISIEQGNVDAWILHVAVGTKARIGSSTGDSPLLWTAWRSLLDGKAS
ncbi:hypothetical protein M1466_01590 [Candidatus Dependentiae bacterium]|nr:hypothetical protein [Candidatus Dependentiae bacterium]